MDGIFYFIKFEAPSFLSCNHILFEIVFVMDVASLMVKQLSLIASEEVIA